MRIQLSLLVAVVAIISLAACACSSTRPDATDLGKGAQSASGGGTSSQKQGHLGAGGFAIAEDGNATGGATTRLGVDVQGAANAAANPVQIGPLTGNSAAAADILRTETREEKALGVKLERIQRALQDAETDLATLPEDRHGAIRVRMGDLEEREDKITARLGELHTAKLDAAKALVPDLSQLRSVWYSIYAPQTTTSGKAMTDGQTDATSAAFQAWIKAQEDARARAAAEAGNGGGS